MSSGGEQQKFVPVTSLDCLSDYDAWLVKTSEHYGFTYHGRDVGFVERSGINKASDRRYSTSDIAHFIFGLDDREISGGIHFAKLNESTKFQGAARWFSVCGNHKKTELKQLRLSLQAPLAAEKAELKRMVLVALELTKQDVAADTRDRLSPRFEMELRHLESLHLFPSASVTTMGDHTLSHMSGLQFTQSSPNIPPTASAAESEKSKRSHSNEVSEDSVSFSDYHYKPHRDKKDAIPLLTTVICALEERARLTESKRKQEIANVKPLDTRWWAIMSRTRKEQHLEGLRSRLRRELPHELKVINDLKIEACKLLQKVEVSLLVFVEQSSYCLSTYDAWLVKTSEHYGFTYHVFRQPRDKNDAIPHLNAVICALEERARVTESKRRQEITHVKPLDRRWWAIMSRKRKEQHLEGLWSRLRRELPHELKVINDLKIEACKLLQKVEVSLLLVSSDAELPSIVPAPVSNILPDTELNHARTASESPAPQKKTAATVATTATTTTTTTTVPITAAAAVITPAVAAITTITAAAQLESKEKTRKARRKQRKSSSRKKRQRRSPK
ncbi:hypothetical protein HDU77_006221 [Chytriomyces hyalinus]|nr:hypothetical protein HDU77_006221 [Chytriomyces hyalinus]